jgi:hypothetical protein
MINEISKKIHAGQPLIFHKSLRENQRFKTEQKKSDQASVFEPQLSPYFFCKKLGLRPIYLHTVLFDSISTFLIKVPIWLKLSKLQRR